MNQQELVDKWKSKLQSKEDVEKYKFELLTDLRIHAVENLELVTIKKFNEEVK